jgi:hypothetical protein
MRPSGDETKLFKLLRENRLAAPRPTCRSATSSRTS